MPESPPFNRDRILDHLDWLRAREAYWQTRLTEVDVPIMTVVYEDLQDNTRDVLHEISVFLDTKIEPAAFTLETPLAIQREAALLQDWRERLTTGL